jgi:hypothetical protein
MHPSSTRAFQREQEHDLKHPSSMDLISTKQNKTNKPPCFIDTFQLKFLSFGQKFTLKKPKTGGKGNLQIN